MKISWKSEQKYQSYRYMKICIKMWMKTCLHSHFRQFFMCFYDGQLKQQICNPFKITFPDFDVPNAFFSQIQQAPGPDFRKVGKSLLIDWIYNMTTLTFLLWVCQRCIPYESLSAPSPSPGPTYHLLGYPVVCSKLIDWNINRTNIKLSTGGQKFH